MNAPAIAAVEDILIERDVDVLMRDGARLKADVFRPDGDGPHEAAKQKRSRSRAKRSSVWGNVQVDS